MLKSTHLLLLVLFVYDKFSKVQFSQSVVSNSLPPHWLQDARLPCPSPTPRAYSNSCPLSRWCHPTISSSSSHSPALNLSQNHSLFKRVSSSHQVAKVFVCELQHQSFQWILGLISFRMDWLDLLVVQGTQESSPTPQFKSINSSALSFLYSPTLTQLLEKPWLWLDRPLLVK